MQKKITLTEGSILHTAYATKTTNVVGQTISAAVAVGIPVDEGHVGVIMEFSDCCTKKEAAFIVEKMVEEAMQKRNYSIKEIKKSVTEATCEYDSYTTVFAAISIW